MVWYSHLFKNFQQFVVIHTIKGFGVINKAEIDVFFWNSLAFSIIQWILAIWSLFPLPFLEPAWTSGSSRFPYCWSLAWRILSITLLMCEMSVTVWFSSVQWLSHVRLLEIPWIAAPQRSLSITNSLSSLKLMSIESVMPSSHLILCCPRLLLPPIPPSIRVFSNE